MARSRKSGPRTPSGRLSRAQRRIAPRTAANALARGAAAELAEEPIKPRRCRHESQLELLESRGAISRARHGARDVIEMIGFQLELMQLETPDWTPRQQLQEARCVPEITAANQAVALANARALPATGPPSEPASARVILAGQRMAQP